LLASLLDHRLTVCWKQALEVGRVILDYHVRARMTQRKVTLADVYRAVRAGAPQQAELDKGT
jgi:hypothetical protein